MRNNNPFVFFTLLFVTLLLIPVGHDETVQPPQPNITLISDSGSNILDFSPIFDVMDRHGSHVTSGTASPSSGHSDAVAARQSYGIKGAHDFGGARGHGSTAGMRNNNPFVFFAQLFFTLLLIPVGHDEIVQPPQPNSTLMSDSGSHILDLPRIFDVMDRHGSHVTSGTASTSCRPSDGVAAPQSRGIKGAHDFGGARWQGSAGGMRNNKPFVYFAQLFVTLLLIPVGHDETIYPPQPNSTLINDTGSHIVDVPPIFNVTDCHGSHVTSGTATTSSWTQ